MFISSFPRLDIDVEGMGNYSEAVGEVCRVWLGMFLRSLQAEMLDDSRHEDEEVVPSQFLSYIHIIKFPNNEVSVSVGGRVKV